MSDFETHPLGTAARIKELERKIEYLEATAHSLSVDKGELMAENEELLLAALEQIQLFPSLEGALAREALAAVEGEGDE